MPRYEFNCQKCGNTFIVAISIAERDKVRCPDCGSKNIKQKFSPISISNSSAKGSSGGCGAGSFG